MTPLCDQFRHLIDVHNAYKATILGVGCRGLIIQNTLYYPLITQLREDHMAGFTLANFIAASIPAESL